MKNFIDKILRKLKILFETNNTFRRVFNFIASTWFYRKFIYYKINKFSKNIEKNKNYNVIIETSNLCNAKCVMCPYIIMERKKELMDDDTFDLVMSKLKNENIVPLSFILNGFGEPLTDKRIFPRVKKIKELFPTSIIKFYSNFGLANIDSINALVNSDLNEINISFNGYDKDSYEETMKLDYNKTKNNLLTLLEKRKEVNGKLKIRLSMALVKFNENGINEFIGEWKNKVDSISVNRVHNYGGNVSSASNEYKIEKDKVTYPCKYLWNTIVFNNKGDIQLCCLDYESKHTYGNIKDQNILGIFYSKKLNTIRDMHYKGDVTKMKICKECYTPYKNGVEWLIDELY